MTDVTGETIRVPFQTCDRCARYPYPRSEYVKRALWELVQATIFRFSPRRAYRWRNALLRMFGARIAPHAQVRPTCRIFHPWLLTVGEWTALADEVVVYNLGPVELGEHSVVSQNAYLCAGTHDYTMADLPLLRPPIKIGSGVWICAQAFVGPGVTIGDNSVIGARGVVIKDIPPNVVAGGNPCRVIKPRLMRESEQR